MIEIIIKNYLAEKLSVPVVLEVPADPPESFVLLGIARKNGQQP